MKSPHHGRPKTVQNKISNVRYNKINIKFPDWVIDENIIPRNMTINLGCTSVDNHIPRDDIFDYHPIRERNIYIIFPIFFFCQRETFSFFGYKFDKFEMISELVSSDKTVFLCYNATQV